MHTVEIKCLGPRASGLSPLGRLAVDMAAAAEGKLYLHGKVGSPERNPASDLLGEGCSLDHLPKSS